MFLIIGFLSFIREKGLLISLSAFLLLVNLIYFIKPYIVSHDTLNAFSFFYFFYNEFYFYGHIAQWMPNFSIGMPASYTQLAMLTPAAYLCILAGKILHITNVLLMFKVSMLLNQIFFLMGMYLLAKELFKERVSIFIVCVSGLSSLFWDTQLDFQLLSYYLLPLVFYFMVRFYKENNLIYFFLALMTILGSAVGSAAFYFIFLHTFYFFVINTIFWIFLKKTHLISFKFNKSIFSLILLILVLLVCFYIQLTSFQSFVDFTSRGKGINNPLPVFLTYGGNGALEPFLLKAILGQSPQLYLGILPVLFLMSSLFFVRSVYFWAIFLTGFIALWLSFAGLFASICYFFPTMPLYRHINYVWGLYKVPFLISAGFGFDYFLQSSHKTKVYFICIALFIPIFLLDSFGISRNWLVSILNDHMTLADYMHRFSLKNEYFRISIYVVGFIAILISILLSFIFYKLVKINGENNRFLLIWIKLILIACVLLDVYSYQRYHRSLDSGVNVDQKKLYVLETNKAEFQPTRITKPQSQRQRDLMVLLNRGNTYAGIYNAAQFSPCKSEFREDYVPKILIKLESQQNIYSKEDLDYIKACEHPKLTLNQFRSGYSTDLAVVKLGRNINVELFTTDELKLKVDNNMSEDIWLMYADAFHPGWKAQVNGKLRSVYPSNVAFKSVRLDYGKNSVRLFYDDLKSRLSSYFIAFFGLIFSVILCFVFLRGFFI